MAAREKLTLHSTFFILHSPFDGEGAGGLLCASGWSRSDESGTLGFGPRVACDKPAITRSADSLDCGLAGRDKSPPGYWKQFARHGQAFYRHPGLSSPSSCARQTESWRDRIMQRERPGGRSSIILSFPVAALPCCALCGWRTPVYGIKDSGKGGCRRFHGFRRSRVSGPGGCWSLPLPNG